MSDHKVWMRKALELATSALEKKEVPVGSVIINSENKVIGIGVNRVRSSLDPTAHAEILAIRDACNRIRDFRLTGSTIYSTLEPCAMCAGAIVQARIKKVVIGARDHRFGAAGSCLNLLENQFSNHQCEVLFNILGDECSLLLKNFFIDLRL